MKDSTFAMRKPKFSNENSITRLEKELLATHGCTFDAVFHGHIIQPPQPSVTTIETLFTLKEDNEIRRN